MESASLESTGVHTVHSPLAETHLAAGAKLVVYHGVEVPSSFGDATAEHKAVRDAAGMFDFSFRSKFVLTGENRIRFLHRIVSNDIKGLNPGQGTYAALLSAQGRILADLRIYVDEDRIWVDTDADLAEKAMGILRRYIIGERVLVEPSHLVAVTVQGPAARRAITRICGHDLAPLEREMDHRAVEYAGRPARIVRLSSTGEEGYEVWLERDALAGFWTAAPESVDATPVVPCGSEALESLRIEAGIPRYGADLGEDTLPLEAGLLNALSFNKGCYIGQEIVERARSRGHVNWMLMGLRFGPATSVPKPGESVTQDEKTIGEITSSCSSPCLAAPISLAYLRREVAEPGTRLRLANGDAAEVCALPFFQAMKAASEEPADTDQGQG
jgi:glycine cleavage system T protein